MAYLLLSLRATEGSMAISQEKGVFLFFVERIVEICTKIPSYFHTSLTHLISKSVILTKK
jgi:hypothetical protein